MTDAAAMAKSAFAPTEGDENRVGVSVVICERDKRKGCTTNLGVFRSRQLLQTLVRNAKADPKFPRLSPCDHRA